MKKIIKKIIPKSLLLIYHRLLAILARLFFKNPSKDLMVIGVTGTDGKTTSVILISHILDAAGIKNAYMTTAEFKIGNTTWINETKQTMPGRFQLQRLLKRAVREGCTHVIVETSSQGIEQYRHLGVEYDTAVFTNLSRDHIEAHGSFERYRDEKVKLFKKVITDVRKEKIGKSHIINISDPNASYFCAIDGADNQVGIFIEGDEKFCETTKSVYAKNISLSDSGMVFDIVENIGEREEEIHISSHLIGLFNVYNILGAVAACRIAGVSRQDVMTALDSVSRIPGRLETIDEGQDFTVIVDYAHAENALETVFETIVPLARGRIISVLGSCGGGRDVEKRPKLGAIAASHANVVIVTNEDPYDEDPDEIMSQVLSGAVKAGKIVDENVFVIKDRTEAIAYAIKNAQPKDIVLITGKGSEQFIVQKDGERLAHDDRVVARELIHEYKISNNSDGGTNE